MTVAVVTPYHREPETMLARAHASVRAQTVPARHVFVADGEPLDAPDGWDAEHLRLPRAHGDFGNTPRALGAISALNRGASAVAFLDADNWYVPQHLERLLAVQAETGALVVCAWRTIVFPDGQAMKISDHEEEQCTYADTSAMLVMPGAAHLLPLWAMMGAGYAALGDRCFLDAARQQGVPIAWNRERTVFYETRFRAHYEWAGKPFPKHVHELTIADAHQKADPAAFRARTGFDLDLPAPLQK